MLQVGTQKILAKMTEFCKKARDTDIESQEKALLEEFKTEAFKSIAEKFRSIKTEQDTLAKAQAELQQ